MAGKHFIIAIGASAGGLEAIDSFFDYTPLDGVSYILIQHLSASYKSQMVQILSRHTQLKVIEATDNIKIEPNNIYLIPSSKFMVIDKNKLILSDKKDIKRPHMTIDHFFISLANQCKERAIGIVLSGTGNDGSEGIKAIKKSGGLVIVQKPETANFKEMPLNAIDTGCADTVLAPEAIPMLIEDYVESDGNMEIIVERNTIEISENELSEIINLVRAKLPLDFTEYKRPTITRRIKRRMVQNNLTGISKYTDFLKNNENEILELANDFLIVVTSFFRDPEAFEIIEKQVIPEIINNKKNLEVLKLWVAGCATGEEAYSFAILIKEHLDRVKKDIVVKIFATDVNKGALTIASKGVFSINIEKTLSVERLNNYFTPFENGYKIRHEIRKMLIFARHDLTKNPPYCNIDLLSCRNVLIYMNIVLQKKVFSMMHFGLKKDGYLFLGSSENSSILKADFSEISHKWNILKSNKIGKTIRFDSFPTPFIDEIKADNISSGRNETQPLSNIVVSDDINLAILEESGFSGVCTDEALKVIKSFGDTSLYLKNQNFNFNLNELLPDQVSIIFKAAAHKALKQNEKVTLNGIRLHNDVLNNDSIVDLIIKPFESTRFANTLLLILFVPNTDKIKESSMMKDADVNQLTKDHLLNLETELAELKEKIANANEKIESSNENMQSFTEELQSANEEMQSANEEMQSSNEELQSVNEELQTINKEHQLTIDELTDLNDDLNNYFRSNTNGQLFVDHNLLLKNYSPGAVRHINIRESDIGRPLSNITTNIKFETFIEDIKKVIVNDETILKEVISNDGKVFQVMTMPYIRKSSNKPSGAIISFYEITELKQISQKLDISNKTLLQINEDLNNFVYGASHDLNAPIGNIEMVLGILNQKLGNTDPDISSLTEVMKNSIVKFRSVITDLGKVGKIEAEMLEESKIENFEELFIEIKEIISERIKYSNVLFQVDFQVKEIKFSKKNLRSIILNLITNAIKFSSKERQPEVFISTQKVEDYIMLSVKDNGIGINKEKVDYVFKMYQRINDDVEGQGIGLYLINKIVHATGGKIEVESEPGKGSNFKIFFKI